MLCPLWQRHGRKPPLFHPFPTVEEDPVAPNRAPAEPFTGLSAGLSAPMDGEMTISNSSATDLLDSVMSAQSARQDSAVALLKKAQDVAKQEGDAMVNMLEQIGPDAVQTRLDTYA